MLHRKELKPNKMKTVLQINNRIKEIESDIKVMKIENRTYDVVNNAIYRAAISAAEKQIDLLKWILEQPNQ